MTDHAFPRPTIAEAEPGVALTPQKLAILVAFATFVWFLAALFIRFVGPRGGLDGVKGALLYALTIPATIPLNVRTRKIVRLPRAQMLTVVATTSATATMWDGIALSRFRGLYGADAVAASGGAWLLWAIGVGLALALITTAQAARKP